MLSATGHVIRLTASASTTAPLRPSHSKPPSADPIPSWGSRWRGSKGMTAAVAPCSRIAWIGPKGKLCEARMCRMGSHCRHAPVLTSLMRGSPGGIDACFTYARTPKPLRFRNQLRRCPWLHKLIYTPTCPDVKPTRQRLLAVGLLGSCPGGS